MRPLAYLRIPLLNRSLAPLRPEQVMTAPQCISITFQLVEMTDWNRFYECTQPGCRGAGCPVFGRGDREIPQWVMEHLYRHVECCEGAKR